MRVWLGLGRDAAVEVPSLPDDLARLFLRLEEHETDRRDQWGRWEFGFSENFHAGHLRVPEVDLWLAERRDELLATTTLEPLWPGEHRFAVCVTHDVDLVSRRSTVRQIARYARAGLARNGSDRGALLRFARPPARVASSLRRGVARVPSARETLERSVAIESERGIASSYLFAVPPGGGTSRYDCAYSPGDLCQFRGRAQPISDVMRALAHEGFDVGLHGSYRAGFEPGALARERETLERATGLSVTTTRQHLLHWDIRATPQLQEDAGLRTDSSLGFNRNVGYRAGTSLPFRSFDVQRGHTLRLLEVPLIVQDVALLGSYGLELGWEAAGALVREQIDAAARTGGALTIVFHPDTLIKPDWLALYELTLDYAADEGAWITSLAGLDEWWSARETRILGP